MSAGKVFRVPSAACSARLPPAPISTASPEAPGCWRSPTATSSSVGHGQPHSISRAGHQHGAWKASSTPWGQGDAPTKVLWSPWPPPAPVPPVCWGWWEVSSALCAAVGGCRGPGAGSHPSPQTTGPARRQETSQQGQLGGSGTRSCLSACSSLEAWC